MSGVVTARVKIYCADGHDRWDVGTMVKLDDAWLVRTGRDRRAPKGAQLRPDDELAASTDYGTRRETVAAGHTGKDQHRERTSYVFQCGKRKCKGRPLPVRAEKLAQALDLVVGQGASEVSLRGLGAILQELARR